MKGALSRSDLLAVFSRRQVWLIALPLLALIIASLWLSIQFLEPMPPRRIVLATGPEHGSLHAFGQRYKEILARDGIAVQLRPTRGTAENAELLKDRASGVDVAFLVAGSAAGDQAKGLVNLSNLQYAPLWVLYRGPQTFSRIADFRGKRVAFDAPGSGLAAALTPVLVAEGISKDNTTLLRLPLADSMAALLSGQIDAVFTGETPALPEMRKAFDTEGIKLMDIRHAGAYARRFPHLSRLELPTGTLDLLRNIPDRDVTLIGTTAMIAAREDLHPTVIDFIVDAAREVHGGQGYFEKRGEFPSTTRVDDLPVSQQAERYAREGPSFLRRYLPLWLADFLQRVAIIGIPIVAVVLPLLRWIPAAAQRWTTTQIQLCYARLGRVDRTLKEHKAASPVLDELLRELERIERGAANIPGAKLQASAVYSLHREIHALRAAVLGRSAQQRQEPGGSLQAPVERG